MAEGAMDIVAVYFFLKMAKKKCKSQTRFCNAECCVKHANDNKGQEMRANSLCETCELQQGTGDEGKLWKE